MKWEVGKEVLKDFEFCLFFVFVCLLKKGVSNEVWGFLDPGQKDSQWLFSLILLAAKYGPEAIAHPSNLSNSETRGTRRFTA